MGRNNANTLVGTASNGIPLLEENLGCKLTPWIRLFKRAPIKATFGLLASWKTEMVAKEVDQSSRFVGKGFRAPYGSASKEQFPKYASERSRNPSGLGTFDVFDPVEPVLERSFEKTPKTSSVGLRS
jgi:hypothetical protein